jgi:hypothetical protein
MRNRILFSLSVISVVVAQPSFTAHSLGNSEYHLGMESADMDNDGDLDLVAPRWTEGDAVVWYENNGSEGFTINAITTDHNYVQTALPIDLDQDGELDVLIGECSNGTYENTITWARNHSKAL